MKVDIKKAVKRALVARGMTQKTLADKLGIDPSTVSGNLSKGNVSLRVLEQYAEAMNMAPSALVALGE